MATCWQLINRMPEENMGELEFVRSGLEEIFSIGDKPVNEIRIEVIGEFVEHFMNPGYVGKTLYEKIKRVLR